jgi:serine/threonine protein kinase
MADRLGQQLGNYRLVALLGTGGFADVYLGQHTRFNQQAAIKVLHAHLSGQEASSFQHEAETVATLAHPAIVRVFDFDVQDGVPFLVMDYAPNGSLRGRYPKGNQVPLPQIVSYVKQVTDALQYAHGQKFIQLKRPFAPFLADLWVDGFMAPLPAHHFNSMAPQAIVKSPDNLNPKVVSGPFMMAESAPGDHYTLVRNHRYYRASEGLPYLDKVEFRIVNRDAILHLLRPLLK